MVTDGEKTTVDEVSEVEDVQIRDRLRHLGKVIFMQQERPVVVCGKGF